MVSAIILSAGSSVRMGQPKALLKIGEKTFLRHIVEVLQSARVLDILIVLGEHSEVIIPEIKVLNCKIAINENWQNGQLSSLLTGIRQIDKEKTDAIIVCPVDRPLITQSLIVDLLQAFWKVNKKIIVPVYHKMRGHPVIFSSALFDALQNASNDIGAREVLRNYPDEVYEVETEEEGVIINIDTPEDYRKFILEKFNVFR